MDNKKLKIIMLFSLILFTLLLSISSVSADGNFSALQNEINNAAGNEYDLDQNYTYDPSNDVLFAKGIVIDRDNFVINGKGFSVDGNNGVRIFNITGNNVTIMNLNFINGKASNVGSYGQSGGAIFNYQNNVTLINCNFTHNGGAGAGGAIFNWGNMTIINSKFTDNYLSAGGTGGAIINQEGAFLNITNSTFDNNFAWEAGAISNANGVNWGDIISTLIINNCNFTNNTAIWSNGGAIASYGGNVSINNCNFDNNSAIGTSASAGGAIYNRYSNVTIIGSNFTNNTSKFASGGAIISWDSSNLIIEGSIFRNNTAKTMGGAIYNGDQSNLTLSNSDLISNNASYGGAIYIIDSNSVSTYVNISYSTFNNNNAITGGAIYNADNGNTVGTIVNINFSNFNNNIASGSDYSRGGAIYNSRTGNVKTYINNSEFNNNLATYEGEAIFNNRGNLYIFNGSFNSAGSPNKGHIIVNSNNGRLYLENNTMVSDITEKIYNYGYVDSIVHVIFLDNTTITVPVGNSVKITGQITDDMRNVIVGQRLDYSITLPDGNRFSASSYDFEDGYYNISYAVNQLGKYIVSGTYSRAFTNNHIYEIGIIITVEYPLNISKVVCNDSVKVGDLIYYNVTITSLSNLDLTNITVIEEFSDVLKYVGINGNDWKKSDNALEWIYQKSLKFNETIVLTLIFEVVKYGKGSVNNTVNITSDQTPDGEKATSNNTTLSKLNTTVTINDVIGYHGDKLIINGTVIDEKGNNVTGNITLTLPHGKFIVEVINGVFTYEWIIAMDYEIGKHDSNALFEENDKYLSSNTTGKVTILKKEILETVTTIDDVEGKIGETVTITGTVIDEYGDPVTGIVNITLPDGTVVQVNVIEGKFNYKWLITTNVNIGENNMSALYIGDDSHFQSNDTGIANISKSKTITTVDDVEGKAGDVVIISGTVIDEFGNPVDGFVSLILPDGSSVSVSVKNGKFEYEWTIPADFENGTYPITAIFEENDYYYSSNSSGNLVVIAGPGPGPTPTPTPTPSPKPADNHIGESNYSMEKTGNPIAILVLALIFSLIVPLRRRK